MDTGALHDPFVHLCNNTLQVNLHSLSSFEPCLPACMSAAHPVLLPACRPPHAAAAQKESATYAAENSMWSSYTLRQYVNRRYRVSSRCEEAATAGADAWTAVVLPRMQRAAVATLLSVQVQAPAFLWQGLLPL